MSEQPNPPRLVAIPSTPSFTYSLVMETGHLLGRMGIPMLHPQGAYWGQCLERAMEQCVESRVDLILAIDHDTAWTPRNLLDLCRLMRENPDVDALAPVQMKRGGDDPLFMRLPGADPNAALPRLLTAHFGFTLLRTSALSRVPHPWFHGAPAASGRWEAGKLDDDINFWRKWGAAGNTLHLAPRVAVGHVQSVVTWPSKDFTAIHQYLGDWQSDGRPADAIG